MPKGGDNIMNKERGDIFPEDAKANAGLDTRFRALEEIMRKGGLPNQDTGGDFPIRTGDNTPDGSDVDAFRPGSE